MNLVYVSCLKNPEYLKQLDLFLNSLELKGNLEPDTHVLVITEKDFIPLIQAKHQNLKFWAINCEDVYDAYTARTKIMEWQEIGNYGKILYLDIDILIANSISKIFNLEIKDDTLYVVDESTMLEHGADFFDWNLINPKGRSFTSAIMLYKNTPNMRLMWDKIKAHIIEYKTINNSLPPFCDQPFIIYNFCVYGKYDNIKLNPYCVNATYGEDNATVDNAYIMTAVDKDLVIIHHPCLTTFKLIAMNRNWNLIKSDAFCRRVKDNGFTLVSIERLENLKWQCQKFINSNFSFVECGVGPGGCIAVMAKNSKNNRIYGFDSFEGMPPITDEDIGDYNKSDPAMEFGCEGHNLSGGLELVNKTLNLLNVDKSKINLIKGYFENSLTGDVINNIGNIAVLRLDGDWYNSTKVCLERLYDRVVDGGVIIIDDYGHFVGAKRATDEFRARRNIESPLIQTDYTEHYWIKEIKSTNIHEDIWTCSDEMRAHIAEEFTEKNYKLTEIGAHKGYSTGHLASIFNHVYAIDNSDLWTDFSRQLNRNKSNITYIKLDLYGESWANLPDCDVSFIDAVHSYEHCMMDINNSIMNFKNLKYIIFDDYGVWDGVKKAVDECVAAGKFKIVKFIGLTDVPGPHGIVKNSHEGVIVRLPTAF